MHCDAAWCTHTDLSSQLLQTIDDVQLHAKFDGVQVMLCHGYQQR